MSNRIGRFEIKSELGRGAQSVVYLAHDPQLDREVALKTLPLSSGDPKQNEALLSEARIVSRLRHPGIVPIFEAGEQEGGLYLVFEYVPGENLAGFLHRRGALPPAEAATMMIRILAAVGAAHAAGVIHRDLKPTNILIDERGEPRVMDFGIACRSTGESTTSEGFSGSPAYMAPEYIQARTISIRSDLFAAGLILIEMLTGRRVFADSDPKRVIQQIAREPVRIPEGSGIDDRLTSIALTATAFEAARRYASADDFVKALQAWLEPEEDTSGSGGGRQATMDFLLRRMRHKGDFPALSETVSAINRIVASESESINKLSSFILKDIALTNKLLRLVNSSYFRRAGGGTISTVSRAIVVLGFDAVRNLAITVLLFEHLQNKTNADQLKEEFLRANFAGSIARELCRIQKHRDPEQAFICSVFHHLGRLLAQFYFPEECDAIRRELQQKSCSEDAATLRVLGLTFEELGTGVAHSWGFPKLIVDSMTQLSAGHVRKPGTPEERLRQIAGFSAELGAILANSSAEERASAMRPLRKRFEEAIHLSDQDLKGLVEGAIAGITEYARVVRINLGQTQLGRHLRTPNEPLHEAKGATTSRDSAGSSDGMVGTVLEPHEALPLDAAATDDRGGIKAEDAQAALAAGIQDISNTMVEGFKLNDILRIILETMYRAMGFRRVMLCIKDARGNAMQGRFGLGPDVNELARRFRFSLQFAPDVFHLAMKNGVDILISDVDDPKIGTRIPEWFRNTVSSKTFVIFPLNIKNNPVAMIYADKEHAGEIVISDKELSLLRTLRNQAVLAIKQGS